jgi:hypothetical protein
MNRELGTLKKLSLTRETIRVFVRTGLRAGGPPDPLTAPPPPEANPNSVRQGTLTATGEGVPPVD